MIVDDIDELFKFFSNFCQCGDKFYVSGILGNGACFDNVPVIIKNNNRYPSDIEESDYVKRIKNLEVISKKGFIDRTKYILTHMDDKKAKTDIKAIRKNDLSIKDERIRTWYNYNKTMVSIHVVTEKNDVPVNLVFCPNINDFWEEYQLDIQFDSFITELRDSQNNVIYESKYKYMREELQQQFKTRLLFRVIETYIDNFRDRYVGPIDKNEAINFAVNTIMASEFIKVTEHNPFKPYIISYCDKEIKGYIVDYIGSKVEIVDTLNCVDEVTIDGIKLLEPFKESEIITKRFKDMENILEIIELAQESALDLLNIGEKQKKLT